MRQMAYGTLARVCGALFGALCLTLFFAPGVIFWLFDLTSAPSSVVLAKRAGVLFLGFALLMVLTRDHVAGPTWLAVQRAIAVMLFAMAFLGVAEWMRGMVGLGIWLAIVVEVVLAALLVRAR